MRKDSLWQRWTRGGQQIHSRSDWQQALGANWPGRVMQMQVTDDFHAKQGRSTGRLILSDATQRLAVYLKRHYRLPWWRGLLATFWPGRGWSPAVEEYHHLQWARDIGVPVPASVAVGEFIGPRGKLQSFLAVEELHDMLPLHRAIPLAQRRLDPHTFQLWKRTLIAEMARLARLLHEHQLFHKDFYLCHFYIGREDTARLPGWRNRVFLIDLHRLAHHSWTGWLYQSKDLAQLLYSSDVPGVTLRDRLRFWRLYLGATRHTWKTRWLRRLVILRWRRYERHNARHPGLRTPLPPEPDVHARAS